MPSDSGPTRWTPTGILFAMSTLSMIMCSTAAPQLEARLGEAWWKERHERAVELTRKGGFDVAFLGDSITQGWEGEGKTSWERAFAPLKAANFGFSGDRTDHALWRLQHGEIVAAKPKVVVLLIGTNDVGQGRTPQAAASGVQAVVTYLRQNLPDTKVLLMALLPRGVRSDDRLRVAVAEASRSYAQLHDGKHVFFVDIGKAFVRADGELRTLLMPDALHLNAEGYAIFAKALEPEIRRLLR